MSTSGGSLLGFKPAAAGRTYSLVNGLVTASMLNNDTIYTAPILCPYPLAITSMGVIVTTAGGAGATVQPAVYGTTANGAPGKLLISGPVLAADVAGSPSGPVAGVIPAGWSWVAALILAATAPNPTLRVVEGLTLDATGTLSDDYGGSTGTSSFPVGAGAVLPNPFAVSSSILSGPVVYVTT